MSPLLLWAVGLGVAASPIPYATASIARGKSTFLRHCQSCHDEDGRGQSSAVAHPPDLTRPDEWRHGSEDADVFSTIRNGAGDDMPPFKADLKDDAIWDLVHFIRSIGPESKRPSLQGDKP